MTSARVLNLRPFPERFAAGYIPEPNSGCWLWLNATNRFGYGKISIKGPRAIAAHRASWEFHTGKKIPPGMVIMHKCDTPACVNPDHLQLGTYMSNCHDMIAKGRNSRGAKHAACGADHVGENNPAAKLNVELVLQIRAEVPGARGWKAGLARKYGVSDGTITNILNRRKWAHV